jgi:large subunit ribosomal protein L20
MRVKGGPQGYKRHKKVLKITKGQRGSKHLLFKRANEAMLKSLWYATRDRRVRIAISASYGSPASTPRPA